MVADCNREFGQGNVDDGDFKIKATLMMMGMRMGSVY